MNKIHDKLRKLLALAERGEGGEKDTAQRMLEKMMLKYGLTLDDLEVETTRYYYFPFKTKFERLLLFQVYCKVLDDSNISYRQGVRRIGFLLTMPQYIQMDMMYSILKLDLVNHIERSVLAFITANDLFASSSASPDKEHTKEELEELEAMMALMRGIKPSAVNPALPDKSK